MPDHLLQLFDKAYHRSRASAAETSAALTEGEHDELIGLLSGTMDVRHTLLEVLLASPKSLLALTFLSADRHLHEITVDFLAGRYESAGRTLRFLWEHHFRADAADQQNPAATIDEKVAWLEANELKLSGWNLTKAALSVLLPDADTAHFQAVWKRLNAVVHPSAQWQVEGTEVGRLAWPGFDGVIARRFLADLQAVVPLLWLLVLRRHPTTEPNAETQSLLAAFSHPR